MPTGIYKRTPEMKTGKYKRTPEHNIANSKSKKGVQKSPEHRASISAAHTGVPHSPEHIDAMRESDAVKAYADIRRGVPLSPEHIVSLENHWENMRGGNDIVDHHYIYDHAHPKLYTMKMTRSEHAALHNQMRGLDVRVPHINTGHENEDELKLMEYIKKIEEI